MGPNRTFLSATLAVLIPVIGFAGGWEEPIGFWSAPDLIWAQDLQVTPEPLLVIEANYEPPPQADWCSSTPYTPSQAECLAFEDSLDVWLRDFVEPNTPPNFELPPSFCGC